MNICFSALLVPVHPCPLQRPCAGPCCSISTLSQTLGQSQVCLCCVFVAVAGRLTFSGGSLVGFWTGLLYVDAQCFAVPKSHFYLQLPTGPGVFPPGLLKFQEVSINYLVASPPCRKTLGWTNLKVSMHGGFCTCYILSHLALCLACRMSHSPSSSHLFKG